MKTNDKAIITVVIAIVLRQDGKILVGHRRNDHHKRPGIWEFPGGTVELNETPEMAAVRETREETNLSVTVTKLLTALLCDDYPKGWLRHVHVFLCEPNEAVQAVSNSGDYTEIAWVSADDQRAWQDTRIPIMEREHLKEILKK